VTAPSIASTSTLVQDTNDISISVTVPTCDLAIIIVGGWYSGGEKTISTATLGGSTITQSFKPTYSGSVEDAYVWYIRSPPTGSQTFAVSWSPSSAFSEGASIYFIWLNDVITTGDPVRDWDSTTGATTPAFNTDTNDLVIGFNSSYAGDADASGTGQTVIANSGTFNSHSLEFCTKAGSSGTTTISGAGSFDTVVGFSVQGVSAVAELPFRVVDTLQAVNRANTY
jgi:hypothetical protein